MDLSIRYNRSTTHIEGIPACTPGTGEERGGVVGYYAQSACAGLTRSGYKMAYGDTGFTTATEALKAARANASASGRKLCANCEKAAKWAASCEVDTESEEFQAEKARVDTELEESNRRYKELEAARKAEAEAPAIDDHAAVAQIRANIEAEEEERAAARRARNRCNYAPAQADATEARRQEATAEPRTAKATKVRKATEAELWKEEREAAEPKPEPFTFEYDATAGILIAAALREKAEVHRREAREYRKSNGPMRTFYVEKARIEDNNAQLLEDAADKIHKPVKAALAEDMGRAIDRANKPFHGQVKDAIRLKW